MAVAAGGNHSLALKADGSVWAWGSNESGQLGASVAGRCTPGAGSISHPCSFSPVQVANLGGVIALAAGEGHSLALKADGTVWAWGRNQFGQVGSSPASTCSWEFASYPCNPTPVQVSGLGGVVALAAGGAHNLALRGDGTVWAWGSNANGQLGVATTVSCDIPPVPSPCSVVPLQVSGPSTGSGGPLSGASALAAGQAHSLALRADGTTWAWGWNASGQLGDGTSTDRTTPIQVSGLTGASAVFAGSNHSLAVQGTSSPTLFPGGR